MKLLITFLFFFFYTYSQNFAIVVNKKNPIDTIKSIMVKRIFLGKSTKWPFGPRITPIDQHPKSAIRGEFSSSILEMKVKKVLKYWVKEMIRGKGKPPKMTKEPHSIVSYVKNNIGAIGYIRKSAITEDLKVLFIRDK